MTDPITETRNAVLMAICIPAFMVSVMVWDISNRPAQADTQPRWEYKILHHNRFGEEFKDQAVLERGWEPVNYTARPGYGSALLLRRRVP